jgi:hypothetical protein
MAIKKSTLLKFDVKQGKIDSFVSCNISVDTKTGKIKVIKCFNSHPFVETDSVYDKKGKFLGWSDTTMVGSKQIWLTSNSKKGANKIKEYFQFNE